MKAIVECIVLHETLHKRRGFLDEIASGLEVMGVKTLMSHFPNIIKPAFVFEGEVKANDVERMLRPNPAVNEMDRHQFCVWEFLLAFIAEAEQSGKFVLGFKYQTDNQSLYVQI